MLQVQLQQRAGWLLASQQRTHSAQHSSRNNALSSGTHSCSACWRSTGIHPGSELCPPRNAWPPSAHAWLPGSCLRPLGSLRDIPSEARAKDFSMWPYPPPSHGILHSCYPSQAEPGCVVTHSERERIEKKKRMLRHSLRAGKTKRLRRRRGGRRSATHLGCRKAASTTSSSLAVRM